MRPDGDQAMTIGRGIRCAAARGADALAIVSDGSALSYSGLVRRMARIANLGREHYGLCPGDRVALIAPNRPEYVEIVAGLSDIGVIVATLSPRLTVSELRDIIDDCTPRLIIIDTSLPTAQDQGWCKGLPVLMLGGAYEAELAAARDTIALPVIEETAPFALAYTSGTTGRPKGVLLPHRSRTITFMAMAAEYRCFGQGERFLAMAPMCHGAGFVFACAALFFGGTTVLFDGRDPEAMLARIGQRDIDGVFLVPTQFARIFDLPDARRDHALKTIISNAAALPQAFKERAIDQFGDGLLHETYGSTEGGIVTNIRPFDLRRKPGSVGLPFPGVEIELRSADGSIARPNEPGELFSRSATSFAGYWNRPEETRETLVDGWVTVGDIATRDAEGYVIIVDRKKDMVVTGGLNVYPREIEAVIARMPGVRDVAVVGRPSREWGESLHAFIVPHNGASIAVDAILAACRTELAAFKVPRAISLIFELPRNASGKILKTTLRESLTK
jgi:acyl-CoA synthetase (AMP-forming)/AMP-acid ligase II